MKLHRPLVEGVVAAVFEVFSTGRPADKILEKTFKGHREWGGRDRRFVAESVYELVRHWRKWWVLAELPEDQFLQRDRLTISNVWQVWALFHLQGGHEPPPWLDAALPRRSISPAQMASLPRAVRESIPDWLDEIGAQEFGREWDAILAALNRPAEVFLRVNTLKSNAAELQKRLAAEEIETDLWGDSGICLKLRRRQNVFVTQAFRDGLFEVQDAASQTVAPMVQPAPGLRVIDACAGAGGKSLHLAALMKNKGKILALDIHEWKLKELKERARRDGVDIIETRVIDSTKVIKRMEASADRVLLDVPCSGLGVLRRNPDTKWRLTPEELGRLHELQAQILSSYSRLAKPGGVLVYATCSLLPSENEKQVAAFLASEAGKAWTLKEEKHHRPDREGADGFYGARLQRT